VPQTDQEGLLDDLVVNLNENDQGTKYLRLAAEQLQNSNVPVAFPTETVYGLGADATRSEAVKGIYTAKQRPSDNPLIVHFSSLRQLRSVLSSGRDNQSFDEPSNGAIPAIYLPLIKKFWPGPLTIILPNPQNSPLAPEVTAGLSTFGARIPRNLLALLLIKLSNRPIAAPSANASTKPSPTAAEHVMEDLSGRIDYIIDGGPCDVGVESTVVDGLSHPPAILRPGGISIEQIRQCPGWEGVAVGYEDAALKAGAPRAPGMKYRHYSPKAKVFLYDAGFSRPSLESLVEQGFGASGFICTREWKDDTSPTALDGTNGITNGSGTLETLELLGSIVPFERPVPKHKVTTGTCADISCWEVYLGNTATDVARDLFWALRELDRKGCDVICVESIDEEEGDVAAAVMNRLRKAAEVQVTS
jgi:L-threonylcarbamoyladenylate synthase